MSAAAHFAALQALDTPVFSTNDVSAVLGISAQAANKVASRLADAGLLLHLTRGRWAVQGRIDPLSLPAHLAAPHAAYVSLQTALYQHGMISQIPQVTYAVTTGRTRRWVTPAGTVSLHHLDPAMFFGYEPSAAPDVWLAVPEKALLDVFYLGPARSRLFTRLPEVEIPRGFSQKRFREMAERIPYPGRRALVMQRWKKLRGVSSSGHQPLPPSSASGVPGRK